MKNLHSLLSKLGFQYKEVQIYLALQCLGAQPASIVAEKTGINRVTSYNLLQKLVDRGIVQSIRRGNIQYFSTGKADSLTSYAERKCMEYKELSKELHVALSRIPAPSAVQRSNFFAKIYSGLDGFKTLLFEELLQSDEIFMSIDLKSSEAMRFLTHIFLPKIRRKEHVQGELYFPMHVVEQVGASFQDTGLHIKARPLTPPGKHFCVKNKTTISLFTEDHNFLQALYIESPSLSSNALSNFSEIYQEKRKRASQFMLREKSNESYGNEDHRS